MKLLRWVLIHWCPCKEGKFVYRIGTDTKGNLCEDEGMRTEIAVMNLEANDHQRLPAKHQKPGDSNRTDSPG